MPGWFVEVASVLVVLVGLGLYVSWRATRLDRLHARVETARASLDAALVRRAAGALELAGSGLLDPAASLLLATAAYEARAADAEQREFAESDLSRALRAVYGQPGFRDTMSARENGDDLLDELDGATQKVVYARRFYNDAVAAARAARRRPLARMLPIAGSATLPDFFEIDDSPPDGADPADPGDPSERAADPREPADRGSVGWAAEPSDPGGT
jgi:hypothetical protein